MQQDFVLRPRDVELEKKKKKILAQGWLSVCTYQNGRAIEWVASDDVASSGIESCLTNLGTALSVRR